MVTVSGMGVGCVRLCSASRTNKTTCHSRALNCQGLRPIIYSGCVCAILELQCLAQATHVAKRRCQGSHLKDGHFDFCMITSYDLRAIIDHYYIVTNKFTNQIDDCLISTVYSYAFIAASRKSSGTQLS
jgi:hypothetical protein